MDNTTVSGNDANDSGGILNDGGTATIIQSTISGNTAISAAGIRNQSNGTWNMVNSTVSSNVASPGGAGGIANNVGTGTVANTLVQLSNVTIANNTAVSGTGGGINNSATVNMKNSIVANNSASANPDCKGTIVSGGYNLIESTSGCTITGTTTGNITGQDPNLTVLNFNFGTTKTHALIFPSPAIDAGNPGGCTDHNNILLVGDQRNFVRHVDGDGNASALCDMGSYERLAFATITPTPTLTHTPTKTHTPTRTPTPIQLVATGIVWLDANRDGIRGGGELALSNVNVEMWDGAKTQLLQSDTTDANGAYQVQGPAGNLRVRVILPNDFTFSPLNQGGNDSVDSDIFPNGQDFGFSSVLATSGATVLDAGMYTGVTPTPFNSATPTQTFTRTQTPTKTNTVPPGSTSTFTPTPTNTPTTTNNCTAKPSKPTLKKPGNNAQVATTRPQLKWNAANCADTYNITVKDAATNKKADGKKNLTALKYKTKELAANKIFKWFVQACNSFGCTKSSTRTFTTP